MPADPVAGQIQALSAYIKERYGSVSAYSISYSGGPHMSSAEPRYRAPHASCQCGACIAVYRAAAAGTVYDAATWAWRWRGVNGVCRRATARATRTARGPYAFGGLVPAGAGMPGFAGQDQKDFDLALGCVLGFRWWRLTAPSLIADPWNEVAVECWQPGPLIGAQNYSWLPGVNEAECINYPVVHKPPVEYDNQQRACGCGFWAYWTPQMHNGLGRSSVLRVLGVVKGTGRTLIGPKGFRCQKAQIVALHLYDQITVMRPNPFLGQYEADQSRAQAWMAIVEDRLATMYPGVRIFSEYEALVRTYPPDQEYAPY